MLRVILILLLFVARYITAQEVYLPTYLNHIMDNPFLISASYAGIGSGFQLRLNGASQWLGIEDAPNTQSFSIENRFLDVLGGGIIFFNDSNGRTKNIGAKVSSAYHLTLSELNESFLSFSLGATFTQFSIDTYNFNIRLKDKKTLTNDNSVNFDISTLYRYNKFAVSLNVKNVLTKQISLTSKDLSTSLRTFSVFNVYTYPINNTYELEPSLYIEIFESDKRSHSDLNLKLRKRLRDGYFWCGISYTFINDQFINLNSLAPLLGFKKSKIYVAYGISFSVNETSSSNYGTHMLTLGLDYIKKPSLARCTKKMGMF